MGGGSHEGGALEEALVEQGEDEGQRRPCSQAQVQPRVHLGIQHIRSCGSLRENKPMHAFSPSLAAAQWVESRLLL